MAKEWTILNYANGNNEYEPEMYRALLDSAVANPDDKINIAVEIGRENREMVKMIRTFEYVPDSDDKWTGVRRYYISEGKPELAEDLGKVNMAAPRALYDFIIWGIKNYPAKHYMLILGGHGASFIGTLTDYSQETPYIMGTAEVCRAINMIYKDTDCKIDILIMDICYMNLLEIIYELGKEKQNTVQQVLTYIEDGPMSGLPYDRLISLVVENSLEEPETVLDRIVDGLNLNLVGIKIENKKLKKLKKLSNDLAYSYLNNKGDISLTPFQLLTDLNPDYPWHENVLELQKNLSSIVLCEKNFYHKSGNLINIMHMNLGSLVKVYSKLSFARGNCWTELLYDKESIDNITLKENFEPTKIRPEGLISLIKVMNPSLKEEEITIIFDKLSAHQGWIWNPQANSSV